MRFLGVLTPEQARALGVPDSRWVITPLQCVRPRKPKQPVEQSTADAQPGSSDAGHEDEGGGA